ncbi:hypothetical protein [Selenomonas sp. FC4001]|uniref:hypothetical protein n=1 Tax=Selenomonas sp. FC4001 TaxID=1408313 RepID=UPI00056D0EF9|nr:hypothetical protein [Selenomonas sp. FC4001]
MGKFETALRRARGLLESRYDGTCTIYRYEQTRASTGEDIKERTVYLEDAPCRLSYDRAPAAADSVTADTIEQGITLFLTPDVAIPPGCYITVTQCGVTTNYENSGPAKVYATHQEIALKLAEEYA